MSEVDDARIQALAGVSLHAPQQEYRAAGPSFGDATLSRDESSGRWHSLTLTLRGPDPTPGSNVRSLRPSATVFPFDATRTDSFDPFSHAHYVSLPSGTRALIVDHALLSNPAWLLDATSEPAGLSEDPLYALSQLRRELADFLAHTSLCLECAAKERARTARRPSRGSSASYLAMLKRMGININFLSMNEPEPEPEIDANCPHAPMRVEALRALFAQHPELAFEAIGALVPHTKGERPRFVLNPTQMPSLLSDWISASNRTEAMDPPTRGASLSPPGEVQRIWPESVPKPAPPAPSLPPPRREKKATEKKATEKKATEKKATEKKATEISSEKTAEAPFTAGQMLMSSQVRDAGYDAAAVKRLLKAGTLERVDFGWFRWKG